MTKQTPFKLAGNIGNSDTLPIRTQFLIFTLFGDYVMERGGRIWTSDLLYLMERLGITERAVRSTLSRMARKKWLSSRRKGRLSQYSLTARGRALLEEGGQRIFEPALMQWDGNWHLVLYSLPETRRAARHTLRTQLSWLGFGRMAAGAWISPHRRSKELDGIFSDLKINGNVHLFCGQYQGFKTAKELVRQCWDLDDLANHYRDFIARYEDEYQECCENHRRGRPLDPQFCFNRRFWLTHEFQGIPLKDPNLPPELLPSDWIGHTGRILFTNYRELLGTYANQFVDDVIAEKS